MAARNIASVSASVIGAGDSCRGLAPPCRGFHAELPFRDERDLADHSRVMIDDGSSRVGDLVGELLVRRKEIGGDVK